MVNERQSATMLLLQVYQKAKLKRPCLARKKAVADRCKTSKDIHRMAEKIITAWRQTTTRHRRMAVNEKAIRAKAPARVTVGGRLKRGSPWRETREASHQMAADERVMVA